MSAPWARRYLSGWQYMDRGRDFMRRRVDCWGFVMAVLLQEFGQRVPSYVDEYETSSEADPAFALHKADFGSVAFAERRVGDVVLFPTPKGIHAGVLCGPDRMIQMGLRGVSILRVSEDRVEGIYRWAA